MSLHKYDDLLSFDLPEDFHFISEVTDKMKNAIDEAFTDLMLQFINLDEERIECVDEYKAIYEHHSVIGAEQAVDEILESCTDALGDALIAALKKIKNS